MKFRFCPVGLKKLSLGQLLLLGFVLPLVGGVGLAFYLLWQNQQRAIEQLVLQIHERVGDRIQQRLLDLTAQPPRSTQIMLQALQRGNLDANNLDDWGAYLRDHSDLFPSLTFVYFGNQAGDYVELYKPSEGQRQVIVRSGRQPALLQQLDLENPNLEGTQVTRPYDPRVRPWYRDAFATRKPRWTDVYDFFLQHKDLEPDEAFPTTLGVSFVRPVYGEDGQILTGVLGSDFTLSEINRFLQQLQISPSGTAFILNRRGYMIASSGNDALLAEDQTPRTMLEIENPVIQSTGRYLQSRFGGLEHITSTSVLSFSHDGQQYVLQVRPFVDAFGLDWLIVIVVPESDFTQTMWADARWTMLLVLAILGMAIVWTLWVVRRVSRATRKFRQANMATQLSEHRYRSLFDNAPVSMWEADFSDVKAYLDTLAESHSPFNIKQYLAQQPEILDMCIQQVRVLEVNQAALELLEADQKVELWKSCFDRDSSESMAGFKQALIALTQGEISYEREQVGLTLTGRQKDVLLKFSLAAGHEQDWSRVLISMVDISDRKLAEDMLRRRARCDRLSSQISKALMNQDIDPAIQFALRELGAFTACDRVCIFRFLDQGQLQMTHEWCRSGINAVIQDRQLITPAEYPWLCKQVSQLQPFQFEDINALPPEAIATRQEFQRQSIRSFMNIPLVYQDQAIGLMGFDTVRASKQWSRADVNLCQLIGEMIAIAQGKNAAEIAMKQAKEEAEAANLVKSEFLANMSHELRSPLNAILGFSQLMARSRSFPAEHREDIETITRSGEYLLSLINDVLDMSKIEAGKISINPVDFNLDYLLDDLERLFQLKAREKQLAFVVQREATLPNYVSADQRKLRQILINILGNAFKFTQTGSVSLRVSQIDSRCEINPKACPMLLFEVQDTGLGVYCHEMAQVFDPFIQTQTGQTAPEGTGLGLPISRNYVELMGGKIVLVSRVSNEPAYGIGAQDISTPIRQSLEMPAGTTVRFTIPLRDVQPVQAVAAPPQPQVIALAKGQRTYRILVVDDSPYNRRLMCKLLESVGFRVRQAQHGQEALDIWPHWRPDLIWMDLKMPVMDGLEATWRIRRASFDDPVQPKIIALSASSIQDDQRSALQVGCDAYMRKPFRASDVFDMMHQQIGVTFLYDEPERVANVSDDAQTVPSHLSAEILAPLPSDLSRRLESALLQIDWQQLLALIDEIRADHQEIARMLSEAIHQYQYQPILDMLQAIKEER